MTEDLMKGLWVAVDVERPHVAVWVALQLLLEEARKI